MTTNDGMPKLVKSAPCATPIAIPHSTPAAIARYGSQPCLTLSTAITAAARPLTAPTERSISPSSSTYTTPTEIRPTAVIWSIRLVRLTAVRKRSFWDWKMIQITTTPRITRSDARSPCTNRRRTSTAGRALEAGRCGWRRGAHAGVPCPVAVLLRARRPGDRRDDILAARLAHVEGPGGAAETQHEDAVCDLEHVCEVVADHDHAEATFAQPLDQLQHRRRLRDAERGRGLVEQHDLRLAQQRSRDRDLLALAAGEAANLRAHARDRDGELLEQLVRPVLHRRLVELVRDRAHARADDLLSEKQVGNDVEVVAQREVLVDGRDTERRRHRWGR